MVSRPSAPASVPAPRAQPAPTPARSDAETARLAEQQREAARGPRRGRAATMLTGGTGTGDEGVSQAVRFLGGVSRV